MEVLDGDQIKIRTSPFETVFHRREGVSIRRTYITQLVAPVDYGSLTSFLLSFLEEQGWQVVPIHEWEVEDGTFDDGGEIPKHITDDLNSRDLSKIVWIGEAEAPVPNKIKLLEDVAAGHVEPTDT